jgi:hypothetical protein
MVYEQSRKDKGQFIENCGTCADQLEHLTSEVLRSIYITWIPSVVAIGCNDRWYYNNREGLQPS